MRYLEIILKLAFLVGSIFFIVTGFIGSSLFDLLLIVCIVLGLILIINKDASYHFKQSEKDLIMRRIEGGALIIFACVMSAFGF